MMSCLINYAKLCRTDTLRLGSAVAAFALCSTAAVAAEPQPGAGTPVVQVIDPMTVSPLFSIPPWVENGPAQHRRVVTHAANGAVALDIGYNTYNKGVRLANPYAYKTDELCYIATGLLDMHGEDGTSRIASGMMMWRPAGGVTKSVDILEDTLSICAMAPARLDANSHRVSAENIGKWDGDPKAKPYPHWFKVSKARVITSLDKSASKGVVERELVSKRKDGSAKVSVVYITLKAGAHLATSSVGEEICWLESGALRLNTNGEIKTASAHDFIYRPEGAKIDSLEATSAASMVCFTGPSAL
jgi:ethanolamine utilization protein EutQ (cupin superfamily)